MELCDTCEHLSTADVDGQVRPYCTEIGNCDLTKDVTAMDDEGGQYAIVIVNNPSKFGCTLHSKVLPAAGGVQGKECG